MTHSLVTLYTEVGGIPLIESTLLVEMAAPGLIEAAVAQYLTNTYGTVEQPMCMGTIVFEGHKNGDSISVSISSIQRVSPEEAEVLSRFIPILEPE